LNEGIDECNFKQLIDCIIVVLVDVSLGVIAHSGGKQLGTLIAYINHNQDRTLTAKSLHVHNNTLK
jgi:DNA-binding PucR family transcriptional regulator